VTDAKRQSEAFKPSNAHGDELGVLLRHERGQFLEFLSAYQYNKGGRQQKTAEELAREIAKLLSGLANADGGTLLVGVEPDKSVTGIPLPAEDLQRLGHEAESHISPAVQAACRRMVLGNLVLIRFDVNSGFDVHRMIGGRAYYRVATENPPLPPEQIERLKGAKRAFFYERQGVPEASFDDLDVLAVEALKEKTSETRPASDLLTRVYHLMDDSGSRPLITAGALLLFGKEPTRWHPRCGIDFVKYEGTDRQLGADLNIVKRIRLEFPLCRLIDEAAARIKEHIRERTVLHDLFFRERLEYPTFAWQEALVNAVAHRDYSLTGAGVEIWMFDDRIEVRSPGLPPAPVSLEELRNQKRVHYSRNPLLVRVLADLGYLREIGEGIPRIFQEMERHGLRSPEFSCEGFYFTVTLRNAPIYDEATLRWLNQFGKANVNFRQRRLLAYAYSHGKSFSTADYQRVGEVDRDTAYREIRAMIRLGIVAPLKPKSRSYKIVEQL
jgi:ATP-dependent DNA helicase RecG